MDFKLRRTVILLMVLSAIVYSKDLLGNIDNRFAAKLELTSINSTSWFSDSLDLNDKTFSLKPMVASLVIPGLGQYLNKSVWWKTAVFAGVEIGGILGYLSMTKKADEITQEYENWADEHWDMNNWVTGSAILQGDIQSNGYPGVNDVKIDGSHHITLIVNGRYESSDILVEEPNIDYVELRDWDFYEGIGKYDQFVAGWDDAKLDWKIINKKIKDGEDELIVMTPNKKHYIGLRNDSNVLYKNAKFVASALLLNHILSAFDALWSSNINRELSYELNVSMGSESKYIIKGISVQWNLQRG